ncbi:NAD(P)-dependent oxidoreductase [Salimicrobium flavidum]|uniref:Putative NADH-flavin reductase n=1 Tax=Salimicrobium flavidum TaxID=570947 RepID=A0A1N7JDA8_9BACI|nr:NAD(P)H-binding protein [Salimicrobium flavidum]SIS47256.1 Putative NADH-flavin reductase [Salimicrobium flavidum]
MHIAILGGTGRVGSMVANALIKEHTVSALVRNSEKADRMLDKKVTTIEGDALDESSLRQTLMGADIIFSALSTDKTTTLSDFAPLCLRLMKEYDIPRIVTIGTAGILNSRNQDGKLRYQTNESKRKITFAAEEHEKVFNYLSNEDRDWVILCPTYLPDEEKQGPLREEVDYLPENGKKAPVTDVTDVAFREITSPSYHKARIGLAL